MESQWVNFWGLGIPLLVAAVTAILAYWREQRLKRIEQQQEREEALRRYKQELYSSLQLSVFNIWAAKGIAKREVEALCKISDAWIFASDTVLRQVNLFMQTYDDSRRKGENFAKRKGKLQPIVAKLFLLMRRDLFSSTGLTPEEAQESVRYYPWVGKQATVAATSNGQGI